MMKANNDDEDATNSSLNRRELQRSNSFPGSLPLMIEEKRAAIITHRAADNGASGIVVSPLPTATTLALEKKIGKHDGSISSDENENASENDSDKHNNQQHETQQPHLQQYKPESTRRKVIRRTLFGIAVLFGNTVLSAYLKRYGIISKDLHEVLSERLAPVAEQVMPELQQRLELLELRMKDTLESARLMAPGFNETLYWLRLNETADEASARTQAKLRPGYQLAEKTEVQAKYPVVMVPGFVTSGLEVWKGKACMDKLFRERLWGGFSSAQYWLRERYCVMENLALDPISGGDPEGIKLRSAQGFQAADFFVGNDWMWGNYWVWSKIFENLADVGYDASSMAMEAYDWRLAFQLLEKRDGYLTHLKHKIEAYRKSTGRKVILISHSMGAIVVHYFFAWVTTPENRGGGGGGKKWVDKHVHAFVNIAGAQLGVIKASTALLSGEMSDTVFLGGLGNVVERFVPRKSRKDLWSSWGSLWAMLPKGGDGIWSVGADVVAKPYNQEGAIADEEEKAKLEYADALAENLLVLSDLDDAGKTQNDVLFCNREELIDPSTESMVNEALLKFASRKNHTVEQTIDFLLKWGGGMGPNISSAKLHSFSNADLEKPSARTWHDISRTPLPHAPSMKIYCMYGVGIETERAYVYKRNRGEQRLFMEQNSSAGGASQTVDPPFILDTSVEDPDNEVVHGIKYADGDGSVPLMSLGYMCAGPWREKNWLNPSGSKVIIREYLHQPEFTVDDPIRNGPRSSEHVDILGNIEMMEDLMKIVTDHEVDTLDDKIESDIMGIVQRIGEHPNGGLHKPKRRWR
ncbi:lecithin:cholesterol acyltransferase [Nitzschia inconspicua]|uniref:Lecithin:cholesterol acyltransferase n=1 Tax=Nitzschia inconspicua TaxID=303405 RepID=A0A9K3LKN9_9STRA|nr:lecithin:cholesterol acyltransferase [Nitzschia inconspicua]